MPERFAILDRFGAFDRRMSAQENAFGRLVHADASTAGAPERCGEPVDLVPQPRDVDGQRQAHASTDQGVLVDGRQEGLFRHGRGPGNAAMIGESLVGRNATPPDFAAETRPNAAVSVVRRRPLGYTARRLSAAPCTRCGADDTGG